MNIFRCDLMNLVTLLVRLIHFTLVRFDSNDNIEKLMLFAFVDKNNWQREFSNWSKCVGLTADGGARAMSGIHTGL